MIEQIFEHRLSEHSGHSGATITGRHLLMTLSGCSFDALNDRQLMERLVRESSVASGAQVLNVVSHGFEPHGVTVVALLSESHASMHTYPEFGIAYFDCFTCGEQCSPQRAAAILIHALNPAAHNFEIRDRIVFLPPPRAVQ